MSTIELFFDLVLGCGEAGLGVLAAVVVGGVLAESAWERRPRAAAGGMTSSSYPLRR